MNSTLGNKLKMYSNESIISLSIAKRRWKSLHTKFYTSELIMLWAVALSDYRLEAIKYWKKTVLVSNKISWICKDIYFNCSYVGEIENSWLNFILMTAYEISERIISGEFWGYLKKYPFTLKLRLHQIAILNY